MAMCVCICAGRGDALNRRQSHVEHWPSLSCRNAQLAQHCREKTQSFQGENDIKVTLVQSGRQYRNTSSYYTLLYCAVQVLHFLLNKLKVYGHLCGASLSVPFFQQHLPTWCLCVTFW